MPTNNLERKYEYRRHLPHYQKAGRAIFITFRKGNRIPFTPEARDAILQHCLHDHSIRYELHAAVVMPDHVHLLLTPLRDDRGWPHALPQTLKLLKGTSARSINKLQNSSGPVVWQEESFDHVLRSQESFEQKREYIRENPVRKGLAKNPEEYRWLWVEQTAENRASQCGTDTPVRRLCPWVDGVGVGVGVDVAVASVGRTLLSVAFALAVGVALVVALAVAVALALAVAVALALAVAVALALAVAVALAVAFALALAVGVALALAVGALRH